MKSFPQWNGVSNPTRSCMYRCTNSLCVRLEAVRFIRCDFFVQLQASHVQPRYKTVPSPFKMPRLRTIDQANFNQYCPYLTKFMKLLHTILTQWLILLAYVSIWTALKAFPLLSSILNPRLFRSSPKWKLGYFEPRFSRYSFPVHLVSCM